jgi:hypothetical protein
MHIDAKNVFVSFVTRNATTRTIEMVCFSNVTKKGKCAKETHAVVYCSLKFMGWMSVPVPVAYRLHGGAVANTHKRTRSNLSNHRDIVHITGGNKLYIC